MTQTSSKKHSMSPRGMVGLGLSLAATFYFMFTYTGPFQWLAELQLHRMGSYSEKLTFLVVCLGIFGLLALVSLPFRYMAPTGGAAPVGQLIGGIGRKLSTRRGIFILIGIALTAFGARDYRRAAVAGPLTNLDVAQLEAGQPPQSSWVRAYGYAVTDAAIEYGKSNTKADRYIPVVSRANDIHQTGVHLFIKARHDDNVPSDPEHPGEYEGLLTSADLPGPVRTSLEQQSLLHGAQYYVLDFGLTPAKKMDRAKTVLLVGAGITAAAILFSVIYQFRPRST